MRWIALLVFALPALAAADPIGTWRGTSLCTVKPSPCHDEVVVYHVTRAPKDFNIQADKIVDGKALDMGTLTCTWDGAAHLLTCPIPKGVFRFQLDAAEKKLTGTLHLEDGTLFRRIAAEKSSDPAR